MHCADPEKLYLINGETLQQLQKICSQLHGGTDRERDYGHRMWLMLDRFEEFDEK